MKAPSSTPHIVDTSKIADMQSDFAKKHPTGCPYHVLIGHLNNITAVASGDKLLPVRKVIKKIYALGGNSISHVKNLIAQYLPDSMCSKSKLKMTKHIYDILFIEQEIYPIIHNALVTNQYKNFSALYPRSSRAPLENIDVRREAGDMIAEYFVKATGQPLDAWMKSKVPPTDDFTDANIVAANHASLTRGGPASMATIFFQGASDAFHNLWSIIYYVPELFYKKYNRFPTREEYRKVVSNNISTVLLPMSSLHLASLNFGLRSDTTDESKIGGVDNLDISLQTHSLDEDNSIVIDRAYLRKVLIRMDDYVEEIQVYPILPPPLDGPELRTGCPALNAFAPDGKRVVEHFMEDCMALFDKVYFPHWKE